MGTRAYQTFSILGAAAATGAGTVIDVRDYSTIMVGLYTNASSTLTAKIQGTMVLTAPAFDTAKSADNMWDYVEMVSLDDGTVIDGSTGLTTSGSALAGIYELNTNGLTFMTVNVTAFSGGTLTAVCGVFGE